MKQPKLDSNFEKFDAAFFTKKKEKYKVDSMAKVTKNTKNGTDHIQTLYEDRYREFDVNGFTSLEIKQTRFAFETYEYFTPYLAIYKRFDAYGNIRLKGVTSWLGFSIGTTFSFDENGRLISSVNNDLGYSFTFDQVLDYCKLHNIYLEPEDKLKSGVAVAKMVIDGAPCWYIRMPAANSVNNYVILDGKDGKLIKSGTVKAVLVP